MFGIQDSSDIEREQHEEAAKAAGRAARRNA